MRYLSLFTNDALYVELDLENGRALLHDRRPGSGLRECKHFIVPIEKDRLPADNVMIHALTGAAMLVYVVDGPYYRNGSIVIKAPKVRAGTDLFLCPVCGGKGPFEAFPTVRHLMTHNGSLKRSKSSKARNWDDVLVHCPGCSYSDKKIAFDTGQWVDMAAQIRPLPLPI